MTTAATTEFVVETFKFDKFELYIDGNQKVSGWDPKPNAFSLPQVVSCPYRTPTCESSCYVHNLETHQGWLHDLYKKNLEAIKRITETGIDYSAWWGHLSLKLGLWIRENCADTGFRWHVSGDIFSEQYAHFIRSTAKWSEVPNWIYTRSFNYVPTLLHGPGSGSRIPNLTVNLSADQDNYWLARRVADHYNLRVCYMTVNGDIPPDLLEGDVIFPDYGLRGVGAQPHSFREGSDWWNSLKGSDKRKVCPVDVYGKSVNNRCGPCNKCMK